jgi:hypothetical protein
LDISSSSSSPPPPPPSSSYLSFAQEFYNAKTGKTYASLTSSRWKFHSLTLRLFKPIITTIFTAQTSKTEW